MAEDTEGESVLDYPAIRLIRTTLHDTATTESTNRDGGFDIPVADGIYCGFRPHTGYPKDHVGHLYIDVTDLTHHQRNDELGVPYANTRDVFNQSKTLNVLANELRRILYDELDCDHAFTRDPTIDHGGSVRYHTAVTAAATVRSPPRLPDDEQ